jgi:hypothetical protein
MNKKSQQYIEKTDISRRDFVKKAAYVPPAILTLAAAPEYAKAGSVNPWPRVPSKPPKQPPPRRP